LQDRQTKSEPDYWISTGVDILFTPGGPASEGASRCFFVFSICPDKFIFSPDSTLPAAKATRQARRGDKIRGPALHSQHG